MARPGKRTEIVRFPGLEAKLAGRGVQPAAGACGGGPGGSTRFQYGACGSWSGGRYAGAACPAGPRDLMKRKMDRRSCSFMARSWKSGMIGRVWSSPLYLSHAASSMSAVLSRRLAGKVVPHGPWKPIGDPSSHFSFGIAPATSAYPGVWQSLQPPILTKYSPCATRSASDGLAVAAAMGVGEGVDAAGGACWHADSASKASTGKTKC